MSTSKSNKSVHNAGDLQFIAGLLKHCAKSDSFLVSTKKMSLAQVIALVQQRVDARRASLAAHAAWLEAVGLEEASVKETERVLKGVRQILRARFGEDSKALVDLGLARKSARTLTVEEKQVAVKKRAATRKARHVMGSRQRLDVVAGDGDAPEVPEAPITPTPNASPTPPKPAGSGAPSGAANGAPTPALPT